MDAPFVQTHYSAQKEGYLVQFQTTWKQGFCCCSVLSWSMTEAHEYCYTKTELTTNVKISFEKLLLQCCMLAQLFPLPQIDFSPATILKRDCWLVVFLFSYKLFQIPVIGGIEFYHLLYSENSDNLAGTKEIPGSFGFWTMWCISHAGCQQFDSAMSSEWKLMFKHVIDLPLFSFRLNANHVLLELDESRVSLLYCYGSSDMSSSSLRLRSSVFYIFILLIHFCLAKKPSLTTANQNKTHWWHRCIVHFPFGWLGNVGICSPLNDCDVLGLHLSSTPSPEKLPACKKGSFSLKGQLMFVGLRPWSAWVTFIGSDCTYLSKFFVQVWTKAKQQYIEKINIEYVSD